jgi:hypothetical protein
VNPTRLSEQEALHLLCPPRPLPANRAPASAPADSFCSTGFWGCPERAEEFWQTCLQLGDEAWAAPRSVRWNYGATERLVSCGRLLQFRDLPEGALGWSWFAWLNGATAALSRVPLTELLTRMAPHCDHELAARFCAVVTRPGLVAASESRPNVRVLHRLQRALQEVAPSEFAGLEPFVATLALAGWMAVEEGHLPTVIMLDTWRTHHLIAIAHLRLLADDTDALSEQERQHPLARFWGTYYPDEPHRTHIPRVALQSLARAREHAWSLKEFILDGFCQALELSRQNADLANDLIGHLGPEDRDVWWFERGAGRSITQIDRDSLWQALPGALRGEYPYTMLRLLPIHGVELLRGAYTFAFFWGLLGQRLRNQPLEPKAVAA